MKGWIDKSQMRETGEEKAWKPAGGRCINPAPD